MGRGWKRIALDADTAPVPYPTALLREPDMVHSFVCHLFSKSQFVEFAGGGVLPFDRWARYRSTSDLSSIHGAFAQACVARKRPACMRRKIDDCVNPNNFAAFPTNISPRCSSSRSLCSGIEYRLRSEQTPFSVQLSPCGVRC